MQIITQDQFDSLSAGHEVRFDRDDAGPWFKLESGGVILNGSNEQLSVGYVRAAIAAGRIRAEITAPATIPAHAMVGQEVRGQAVLDMLPVGTVLAWAANNDVKRIKREDGRWAGTDSRDPVSSLGLGHVLYILESLPVAPGAAVFTVDQIVHGEEQMRALPVGTELLHVSSRADHHDMATRRRKVGDNEWSNVASHGRNYVDLAYVVNHHYRITSLPEIAAAAVEVEATPESAGLALLRQVYEAGLIPASYDESLRALGIVTHRTVSIALTMVLDGENLYDNTGIRIPGGEADDVTGLYAARVYELDIEGDLDRGSVLAALAKHLPSDVSLRELLFWSEVEDDIPF